jgi:hypothetical protein
MVFLSAPVYVSSKQPGKNCFRFTVDLNFNKHTAQSDAAYYV